MFKKFISVVLTISFLFAFSACGENAKKASPLKESEFISTRVDEKTAFTYDEYKDYIIVTGINEAPDELEIPEKFGDKEVKAIADDAFANMGWLTEISIPDTVVEIGERAFSGAVSAGKISLSENLYSIGASAFFGAKKIENIRLPLGLQVIGGYAFADCKKLEGISIPKVTVSIGGGAFQNTKWLEKQTDEFVIEGDGVLIHYNGDDEKVTIPEDVKAVSAFCDNFFVKEVVFPESVKEICDHAFINSSAEKITLSKNITKIGNSAFDSCLYLEKVEFNKKLEAIGSFAFAGCQALKEVNVTEKVRTIGDGAFARCEGLEKLTITSAKTEIGENICDSCNKTLKICCPKKSPVIDYTKENKFILDII